MSNFNKYTPEQIYHIENSMLANVGGLLQLLNSYRDRLEKEIVIIKGKNKLFKTLTNIIDNLNDEESSTTINIDSINKFDLKDYVDENGNFDSEAALSNAKEDRNEKLKSFLGSIEDIHNQMSCKYDELHILSTLYTQMYNDLFCLIDYKSLGIKEIKDEPTMEEKRNVYNDLLVSCPKKEELDDVMNKFIKVLEESMD